MAAAIFPNPKRTHPDGAMKWCRTCSRHHRSRKVCRLVIKEVLATKQLPDKSVVPTSLRLAHE